MILVTGFKPFLGESINPSAEILKWIEAQSEYQGKVKTLLLPVVFSEAFEVLKAEFQTGKYPKVIMIGQAGGRSKISLERVALNWFETESPDESGWTPKKEAIDSRDAPAIFTEVNIEEIFEKLKAHGIPVEVSLSAGGYVCNFLYFKVLSQLTKQALFVHVPYLPEQKKNDETPVLDLDVMKNAVRFVVL